MEIGTGAGLIAARVLKARSDVEYLSFEPERYLQRHLEKYLGTDRFKSMQSSGVDLRGVGSGSVDAVMIYGVFTVVETVAIFKYLQEASRVLKKGGVLMFDIFDTDRSDAPLFALIQKQVVRMQSRPFLSGVFMAGYLRELGFVKREPVPNDHTPYGLMHVFTRT